VKCARDQRYPQHSPHVVMTPSRPYLLRALYEWIVDNDCTPHLVARAEGPELKVPTQYIKDGQIVLNIAPGAVAGLVIGNDSIAFSARFGGRSFQIHLPMRAVIGIYARENGQGMVFETPDDYPDQGVGLADEDPDVPPPSDGGGKPSLRVVK